MIRTAFILLSLGLFFSACEKDITLDVSNQKKLVVLSNFTPGSMFRLYLSTSNPIGQPQNNNLKFPANAQIQLFEDGNYVDDLIYQASFLPDFEAPYYYLNNKPKPESEYSIIAKVAGYPEATAKNTVPKVVEIDDLELTSSAFRESVSRPELLSFTLNTQLTTTRQANNPSYYHITAWRIEHDYFLDYQDTIHTYYKAPVDFVLPDNVQTLNIFHESGVLVDQDIFLNNPNGIDINFFFDFDSVYDRESPVYLEVRHVSEDYYLFHKSVGIQEFSNVRESLLSTQTSFIHDNIEGGFGNFSGYAVAMDSLVWW